MKKKINDLLLKMQTGKNCIGETANELLELFNIDEPHRDVKSLEVISMEWWRELSLPLKNKYCKLAFDIDDMSEKCILIEDILSLYEMYSNIQKPPIGLLSQRYWESKRADDIFEAITRFKEKNQPIPIEWIKEYNKLADRLRP